MASIQMPKSVPCQFDKKGWVPCNDPSDNGWCSKHEGIKCASCGTQATRLCDAQMGGLGCGTRLCATCHHSMWDDGPMHVTQEAYALQNAERTTFEQTGQESERMLAKRGVPVGLPAHLQELLDGDYEKYRLKTCWHLELNHNVLGYFPAIVRETRLVVFTPEKELIFRVWGLLDPRDSLINSTEFLLDETTGVGYPMLQDKKKSRPMKIFTKKEIEGLLLQTDPPPFRWAPGLLGGSMSQENFERLITRRATEHGVVLPVAQ